MPTSTYDLISSTVLSSTAASVTFSSIPSTYRDLVLVVNGETGSTSFSYPLIRVNNDSGANYAYVEAWGNGTNTYSGAAGANGIVAVNGGNNVIAGQNVLIYNFFDYATANKDKVCLTIQRNPETQAGMSASRWDNTAAITSLKIEPTNGSTAGSSWTSGSTFYLYGIVS